jgi:molybdenum cofactor cytidylyltransferase
VFFRQKEALVLQRLLANMPIGPAEIAGLGVGGLLMEIHSRPQPRDAAGVTKGNVHAVILAAGQSRRMGTSNKLFASFNGKTMVRQVAEITNASEVAGITVVTGHQAEELQIALAGLDVTFAHNPDFASGLASSLRCGIASLPDDCGGALILLADMPRITTDMIDRQITAFGETTQASIIQATSHGKRGNPVLWPSEYFEALKQISGDVGARHIIGQNAERVVEIELGEAAALDIDTPEALLAEGGEIAGE